MENDKTKQIADLVAGMTCFKKVGEKCVNSTMLVDYALGRVGERTAKHVRAHLLFCDDCAKEVAVLWRLREESPRQVLRKLRKVEKPITDLPGFPLIPPTELRRLEEGRTDEPGPRPKPPKP